MLENKTYVKRINEEINDIWALLRRNPKRLLLIVIIIIIGFGIYYCFFYNPFRTIANRDQEIAQLKQKNADLQSEVRELTESRIIR